MMLLSLTVLLTFVNGALATEYYISIDDASPCPNNAVCRPLQHYADNSRMYFANDTVLYFAEGTHVLEGREPVGIVGVSNLTLAKAGGSSGEAVIRCSGSSGLSLSNSSEVTIRDVAFVRCGGPVQHGADNSSASLYAQWVQNLTLERISVQNSSGVGLLMANCHNIELLDSSFTRNIPSLQGQDDYVYNGGSIVVLWDAPLTNSSGATVNFRLSVSKIICSHGRAPRYYGGGINVIVNAPSMLLLDSVDLRDNQGTQGANLNLVLASHFDITVTDSIIASGNSLYNAEQSLVNTHGGGIFISVSSVGGSVKPQLIFKQTEVYNNTAYLGGGILLFTDEDNSQEIEINITECSVGGNRDISGSGLQIYSLVPYFACSKVCVPILFLTNTTFHRNVRIPVPNLSIYTDYPLGGIVSNSSRVTINNCTIRDHQTTGLLSIDSALTFTGNNYFVNNLGSNGGALALYGRFTPIEVLSTVTLVFLSNGAFEHGGAVFISSHLGSNRQCFYTKRSTPNHSVKPIFYFDQNYAGISGDIYYGQDIDFCDTFDSDADYSHQMGASVISSNPTQVCFCENDTPNCRIKQKRAKAVPGAVLMETLAVVGPRNYTTTGVVTLSSNRPVELRAAVCTVVPIVLNLADDEDELSQTIEVILRLLGQERVSDAAKILNVTLLDCPPGFMLSQEHSCVCNSKLLALNFTCNDDTEEVSCSSTTCEEAWVGFLNDTDCHGLVVHPNCPFDYCKAGALSFKTTNYSDQCALNRSGLLCGRCAPGLSLMLGSNSCGDCRNNYLLVLVIPFAIAGIAMVTLHIALNLTVSVGTINGLIFYANIVKLYEPILLPRRIHFLVQFIAWLNLDLGINTCFYHGMTACGKTWLQFVFPVYIWTLVAVIILLANRISRFAKLVGTKAVPVLATLLLLSYTKLIRTVMTSLYHSMVQCGHTQRSVWTVDGTHYFSSCHALLLVVSLLFLILFIFPFTAFLLLFPLAERYLSRYQCCQKITLWFKPLFDAYGGPYKDRYRFWTGLLLLVRVVVALIVSLQSDETLSINILIGLLIVMVMSHFLVGGVYRKSKGTLLEVFFALNLIFLSAIAGQKTSDSDKQRGDIVRVLLLVAAFLVYVGIIIYHIWRRLKKPVRNLDLFKKLARYRRRQHGDTERDRMELNTSFIVGGVGPGYTTSSITIREPLLFEPDELSQIKQ